MKYDFSRRAILKSSAAAVAAAAAAPRLARAQTASYTLEDLKPGGKLTPFGAEKAGNAAGTIPAWDGGYTTVPAGYVSGDIRPDPFADEKPLFSITASNASQYQDQISAGAMALFQKYPDYRMDVYPTHRTAAAPQWVYDNIYKNGSNAQLSADGNSITNAYGGIPFPIPQNGHEVIWNHLLVWQGSSVYFISDAHTVTTTGEVINESRVNAWFQYPYYMQGGESTFNGAYLEQFITPFSPPFEAGGNILFYQPINPQLTPPEAWLYLVGQRRVRRAPELQYDTPNSLTGGTTNWDEADIFSGKLDEYDWNLVGKKEMIVPYNANRAWAAPADKQFLTHFFNPDYTRWELHRCWVVEATLKPGKRNVDARRVIYTDEDTGSAMMGEIYDASGSLWKFQHNQPALCYDIPCIVATNFFMVYELHAGIYSGGDHYSADTVPQWKPIDPKSESFFTPANLAASAGGF